MLPNSLKRHELEISNVESFVCPDLARPRYAKLETLFVVTFLAMVVVIPNSLRPIKLALFPAFGAWCFFRVRTVDVEFFFVSLSIAATTVFFLIFPSQANMTPELFLQFGFVYAAAPLAWILIGQFLFTKYHSAEICNFLYWCVIAGLGTVVIFFILFFNFGPESVAIFIAVERANANFDPAMGKYGATMHVFGSLIFLGPAFLASDTVGMFKKAILAFAIIAIAFVSGRDALIACLALGVAAFVAFRLIDASKGKLAIGAVVIVALLAGLCFTEIGTQAFGKVAEKISGEGGSVRQEQRAALLEGISASWGLGSGHTGQASYVRNPDKPWKYELLHLAMLFHVGFVGVAIYMIPAFLSVGRFTSLLLSNRCNQVDIFMITGLFTALLSNTTNPYLASFEFQWCLFLPYCYFRFRSRA